MIYVNQEYIVPKSKKRFVDSILVGVTNDINEHIGYQQRFVNGTYIVSDMSVDEIDYTIRQLLDRTSALVSTIDVVENISINLRWWNFKLKGDVLYALRDCFGIAENYSEIYYLINERLSKLTGVENG